MVFDPTKFALAANLGLEQFLIPQLQQAQQRLPVAPQGIPQSGGGLGIFPSFASLITPPTVPAPTAIAPLAPVTPPPAPPVPVPKAPVEDKSAEAAAGPKRVLRGTSLSQLIQQHGAGILRDPNVEIELFDPGR